MLKSETVDMIAECVISLSPSAVMKTVNMIKNRMRIIEMLVWLLVWTPVFILHGHDIG